MAYTDIPTVSVGDLYTASDFNTYLRDNFRAGIPDAFTAQGGIAFGAGADTIGVLALGTAGQWLEAYSAGSLGAHWAAPTSFFDWFTFGAFACSSLNDCDLPHLQSEHLIADVAGSFGIPDTGARTFLTSLSVRRNGAGAAAYGPGDHVTLDKNGDTGEIYIRSRAWGDSQSTSWSWNTQTGLMKSDNSNNVHMAYVYNIGFNVRIKIWGYA